MSVPNSFDKRITLPPRSETQAFYDRYRSQYDQALRRMTSKFRGLLTRNSINATFKIRIKTFDSYYEKLLRFYNEGRRTSLAITDMMGIRIICSFLGDLNRVQQLISENFKVVEIESKGSKHSIRDFGYDSIHLLVELPDQSLTHLIPYTEKVLEIQLRTKLQDAWAEVEHELVYKADYSLLSEPIKRKLASLNASLTLSDIIFQEIREYQKEIQGRDLKRRESVLETLENSDRISLLDSLHSHESTPNSTDETSDFKSPDGTLEKQLYEALDAHAKGNFQKAMRIYTRIIELKPDPRVCSIIYNHRGMVFFVLSDYDQAIQDFTTAIEHNPKNYRARTNRGLAYRMIEKYDKALEDFQKSLEIEVVQVDGYYSGALVYFDLGDFAKALKECEKALNIKPDFEPAIKFLKVIKSKIFI